MTTCQPPVHLGQRTSSECRTEEVGGITAVHLTLPTSSDHPPLKHHLQRTLESCNYDLESMMSWFFLSSYTISALLWILLSTWELSLALCLLGLSLSRQHQR
ncbi:hypothetical protein BDW59DRAFT_142451 [Aspergillus cavernicola]|uniref:Copper transporter n=1 Tax=Aspergillus cavernicola TaxID=176166 RepID=A0ABR4INF3_9EURO